MPFVLLLVLDEHKHWLSPKAGRGRHQDQVHCLVTSCLYYSALNAFEGNRDVSSSCPTMYSLTVGGINRCDVMVTWKPICQFPLAESIHKTLPVFAIHRARGKRLSPSRPITVYGYIWKIIQFVKDFKR